MGTVHEFKGRSKQAQANQQSSENSPEKTSSETDHSNPDPASILNSELVATPSLSTSSDLSVVDMGERRQEMLVGERRKVKRTILRDFVGLSIVLPEQGLCRASLHDISETGLAFDLPIEVGHFQLEEEVAMRVYLNKSTYFPFIVSVRHVSEDLNEGVWRHGTGFVEGSINSEALHHFVRFIETVSVHLRSDKGEVVVSNRFGH